MALVILLKTPAILSRYKRLKDTTCASRHRKRRVLNVLAIVNRALFTLCFHVFVSSHCTNTRWFLNYSSLLSYCATSIVFGGGGHLIFAMRHSAPYIFKAFKIHVHEIMLASRVFYQLKNSVVFILILLTAKRRNQVKLKTISFDFTFLDHIWTYIRGVRLRNDGRVRDKKQYGGSTFW